MQGHKVLVKTVGEDAEIFIEDAEGDDKEEGKEECSIRGDVPAAEDDASVDDVGIPEHIQCAFVHGHARHVVSSVVTVLEHGYVVVVIHCDISVKYSTRFDLRSESHVITE